VLAEGPDPSGRPWLRIARVDGRSDDILSVPARGGGEVRVHPFRLRSPFARMTQVSAALEEAGADVRVRVALVSAIERESGAAAKVKLIKSLP
jgi:phenylacetate-coenzyme A ligase PaaK-like adenylate-forming protein